MERIVLHLPDGSREILPAAEVLVFEARGADTWVHLTTGPARRDVRPLGELLLRLPGRRFFRIHRRYAVNLDRVHRVRRRDSGRDWEVQLRPPLPQPLPVSRAAREAFLAALEGLSSLVS